MTSNSPRRNADNPKAFTRVSNTTAVGDQRPGRAVTPSSASSVISASRDVNRVFTRTASGARSFMASSNAAAGAGPFSSASRW
jgi:hypothetical protein